MSASNLISLNLLLWTVGIYDDGQGSKAGKWGMHSEWFCLHIIQKFSVEAVISPEVACVVMLVAQLPLLFLRSFLMLSPCYFVPLLCCLGVCYF